MKPIRAMYKYELAQCAGVSRQTFSKWLKSDKDFFVVNNCSTSAKIFPPVIVKYLIEKYVIEI